MLDSLPSKNTYYGNANNNAYNGALVQNLSFMTVPSNNTNMTTMGTNNTNSSVHDTTGRYRQYQNESSVSSTQVGFFLFILGLFACAIFLYLLKNRYVCAGRFNGTFVLSIGCIAHFKSLLSFLAFQLSFSYTKHVPCQW
jgi:hypothetical protein